MLIKARKPIVGKGVDIEATDLKADFGTTLSVHIVDIDLEGQITSDPKRFDIADFKEYRGVFVPEGKSRLKDGIPMVKTDKDDLLMKQVWGELTRGDFVTGWYSKGYDIKFLNTRMLLAGLPPMPPIPHHDLYFTAKSNFALSSNRLAAWQEFLNLTVHKTPLLRQTWRAAGAGDPASLQYVSDHCFNDALMLRPIFYALTPYIRVWPRYSGDDPNRCVTCQTVGHLQRRGKRAFGPAKQTQQMVQCMAVNPQTGRICGKWDRRPDGF